MGVSNFINNGISTSKKIIEAGKETMDRDNLNFIQFFGKALKESSIGAYYVFLKAEIDGLLKQNEIENTKNETSNKVAYLIGGYYLNPASLLDLKRDLEKQGIEAKIINERYYSKDTILENVSELKNQLKEDEGKDIVLFGYSSGGMIAHRIGKKYGYKSVSFGASETPSETMVGTLVSLTKDQNLKDHSIPESGVNIVEGFSAMVPSNGEENKNTVRIKNIYSHMSIGKKEVIDEISKQVLLGLEKERI